MDIKTVRVKQYNSTYKHILMVNDKPVCIVRGNNNISDCIGYLMNGEPALKDGKIMKMLDKVREGAK